MRKALLPFLIFLIACGNKKDQSATKNENTDYILSLEGLDSLKLDMTKAEMEKILDTTLTLKHIGTDDEGYDTVPVKYKNADIVLYLSEANDIDIARLSGISTSHPTCKTSSGISIGTDKIKVIDDYTDHFKYVAPVYEEYPVRSHTKSIVAVMDTAVGTRALLFHIVAKKVASMELTFYYEFY